LLNSKLNLKTRAVRYCFKLLGLIGLLFMLLSSPVALASIHTYPEATDQVMWRSLQTLRDRSDRAWQVIFYQRVKAGQIDCLNLRLVSFPGKVELAHAAPLKITAGNGGIWTAPEIFTTPFLTPDAAEFDLQTVMSQLNSEPPLQLTIPLEHQLEVNLLVPPFVVKEWRQVMKEVEEWRGNFLSF
jgi:Protein of unknown function (DUF3122)